jgi:KDO2-lipid IV(A) lauroyltransferase
VLKYWLFRLAMIIAPILPEWLGYRLAALAGCLAYLLASGMRKVVIANQRQVLGDEVSSERLNEVVRGVFHTAALNYYDFFRMHRYDLAKLDSRTKMIGYDLVETEREKGVGVLLASAHLGSMDLVLHWAVAHSVPITVVVEALEPPELMRLVSGLRTSRGINFVPVGYTGMKSIYRALENGEVVLLAADRNIQGEGMPLCFFGKQTQMPVGVAELALRTGAALMPAFSAHLEGGRFQVKIEKPLQVTRSGNYDDDVRRLSAQLITHIEDSIRAYPEQWVVFQPIW